jgi:hypothetical protein
VTVLNHDSERYVLSRDLITKQNLLHAFTDSKAAVYEVARWPHGCRRQCSEVAVPALVGSNPTEGGGFFRRKESDTLPTPPRGQQGSNPVQIPGRMASHGCCVL